MIHAPSEIEATPLCGEEVSDGDTIWHHGPRLDKVDCPECRKRMGLPPLRHLRSVD